MAEFKLDETLDVPLRTAERQHRLFMQSLSDTAKGALQPFLDESGLIPLRRLEEARFAVKKAVLAQFVITAVVADAEAEALRIDKLINTAQKQAKVSTSAFDTLRMNSRITRLAQRRLLLERGSDLLPYTDTGTPLTPYARMLIGALEGAVLNGASAIAAYVRKRLRKFPELIGWLENAQ